MALVSADLLGRCIICIEHIDLDIETVRRLYQHST